MNTTQLTDLGIRHAGRDDRLAVARTVEAAFFDDPTMLWLFPDPARRQQVGVPMFGALIEPYLGHGETYLTGDGNGAAVWLPPGAHFTPEEDEAVGQTIAELATPDELGRLMAMQETFEPHHPDVPYWYLQFLATVPGFQGRGYGSALMRPNLERADREGSFAYHEATTPRNRALYERHGYVNLGEFRLPLDGPPLWRMLREPSKSR